MDINTAFPSQYLKASDLQGRKVTVTMSNITMEKIGTDTKPVLYFQGKEKGVALNKTNSMTIASAYGPNTDGWAGKQVVLYPAWVDFQGKQVQAIRLRPAFAAPQQSFQAPPPNGFAQPSQAGPLPQPQAAPRQHGPNDGPSDSIPFAAW